MRTTIRLDDDLFRRVKQFAVRNGTTFTQVIEDAVRGLLERPRTKQVREPVQLPTFAGNGLQPGVDLDDTASLVDHMEAHDSSP